MKEINVTTARELLTIVDAGLTSGKGNPVPGEMCVEAAVCFVLGLPHGDEPKCVAPAVRRFKIRLNDARWSSNAARAAGMRKVAVAQLGSAGVVDSKQFALIVTRETIRVVVPIALRAAARRVPAHAERLEAAARACEVEPTSANALAARAIANGAYYVAVAADAAAVAAVAADAAVAAAAAADAADAVAAVAAVAADAADAAAVAAVAVAAAADAAADAADAVAAAAADAADAVADAADAGDSVLRASAEICFTALRECGSPGVALWDQIEREDAAA